jgi:hypothetical protein
MDNLINTYKYFSKFVPNEVLKDGAVQPDVSAGSGYSEILSEILTMPADAKIPEIGKYVFSANSEFVSDKVKNSNELILFVEYGEAKYDPNAMPVETQRVAITVAKAYSQTNSDNLNEVLLMNACKNILKTILNRIAADDETCELCQSVELPAELVPVAPRDFFGNAGWAAFINLQF